MKPEEFGVSVRAVSVVAPTHGEPPPPRTGPHPLVGARVELVGEPRYHQRNYIIVEGLLSPIDPFEIRISKDDIEISRRDEWDETRPGLTIDDVYLDPTLLAHRKQSIEIKSPRLVEATGITDYTRYWQDRERVLRAKFERTTDPVSRQALVKRIAAIRETKDDSGTRLGARQFLGMLSTFEISINGRATTKDPSEKLGGRIGVSQEWPLEFWMGSYDVDLLCGYLRGSLLLPSYEEPRATQEGSLSSGVSGPG